jgi:predicted HAD superfamily hydrolase
VRFDDKWHETIPKSFKALLNVEITMERKNSELNKNFSLSSLTENIFAREKLHGC